MSVVIHANDCNGRPCHCEATKPTERWVSSPPPWFSSVLDTCESLSLDNARDRQILWERISEAWPKDAIEAMLADNIDARDPGDHERDTRRCLAAVIAALEES